MAAGSGAAKATAPAGLTQPASTPIVAARWVFHATAKSAPSKVAVCCVIAGGEAS